MWVLDRLEEQLAVLEDDTCTLQTVARSLLPPDAREGDVVQELRKACDKYGWQINAAETAQRRARILARQTKLRKK